MLEKVLIALALALIDYVVKAQRVKAGEQALVDVGTYKLVILGQSWLLRAATQSDGGARLRVVDPDARLRVQTGVCPADPCCQTCGSPVRCPLAADADSSGDESVQVPPG